MVIVIDIITRPQPIRLPLALRKTKLELYLVTGRDATGLVTVSPPIIMRLNFRRSTKKTGGYTASVRHVGIDIDIDVLTWAQDWDCLLYTSPSPRD